MVWRVVVYVPNQVVYFGVADVWELAYDEASKAYIWAAAEAELSADCWEDEHPS